MKATQKTLRQLAAFSCFVVVTYFAAQSNFQIAYGSEQPAVGKPSTGLENFAISELEIPRVEMEALRGSGEAAYRLSQFHMFLSLKIEESDHWLTIAAENGNPTAEYGLGLRLSRSPDQKDRTRSCFWLEKSQKEGTNQVRSLAKGILIELDNVCGAK